MPPVREGSRYPSLTHTPTGLAVRSSVRTLKMLLPAIVGPVNVHPHVATSRIRCCYFFLLLRPVPLRVSLSLALLLRFTVRGAFPPQHPSLRLKKEKFSSPPLLLSRLRSSPPIGCFWGVSRGTRLRAHGRRRHKSPSADRDRRTGWEMFRTWKPGTCVVSSS